MTRPFRPINNLDTQLRWLKDHRKRPREDINDYVISPPRKRPVVNSIYFSHHDSTRLSNSSEDTLVEPDRNSRQENTNPCDDGVINDYYDDYYKDILWEDIETGIMENKQNEKDDEFIAISSDEEMEDDFKNQHDRELLDTIDVMSDGELYEVDQLPLQQLETDLLEAKQQKQQIADQILDLQDANADESAIQALYYERSQIIFRIATLNSKIESIQVPSDISSDILSLPTTSTSDISSDILSLPTTSTPAVIDEAEKQSYPWTTEVYSLLANPFKLLSFREKQLAAINTTLSGKDVFVLMPTGGGKSLCYQLPALVTTGVTRGVTIVISPLLALIEDQVQHLVDLGIMACVINSAQDAKSKQSVYDQLDSPNCQIKLLYLTPEMVGKGIKVMDKVQKLYERKFLARFVIDEAHCVSRWGREFRPEYSNLGVLKGRFPDVPTMALTATANGEVREDVISTLHLKDPVTLVRSFNRPNLFYEVREKKSKTVSSDIIDFIREEGVGKAGIIYCRTTEHCEKLYKELSVQYGISAAFYHGKLRQQERQSIQKRWQVGELHVICATIAFGMGIDKADVRYVLHHTLPQSLEGYYQETGRAGRDGKPSKCVLYYSKKDKTNIRFLISQSQEYSSDQRKRLLNNLEQMVSYCENKSICRRVQVLEYFGENISPHQCNNNCDNCRRKLYGEPISPQPKSRSRNKPSILNDIDINDNYQRNRNGKKRWNNGNKKSNIIVPAPQRRSLRSALKRFRA
ncbi:2440_t:CDS:2 [Paraglomus brasilianum]|uniref:ATP-dependent DNA helicase n=1 Tax=Paraglomus brasilianum TaxID=144538 RepID=A0A9N8VQM9_9GLOM|nr:2440_t:CDS:2 [Paraglomus brasilianum]